MNRRQEASEAISKSADSIIIEDDNAACQSCRRRKLKCSREKPSCNQCSRLDTPCVYNNTRQKPGMKSGAVEALSRRVEALEERLRDSDAPPQLTFAQPTAEHSLFHMSQLLVRGLQRLENNPCPDRNAENCNSSSHSTLSEAPARKRKRQEFLEKGGGARSPPYHFAVDAEADSLLPPEPILGQIVEKYFSLLHHWIPFLHEKRFRDQVAAREENQGTTCVLHAIVCATMRFLRDDGLEASEIDKQVKRSGQYVLLSAMDSPSIEHLQALVIIAFDHNGGARVSKAWSLIGSLTRTVEYLRLTVEPEQHQNNPLRRPLTLLAETKDWTEAEDRRRLFWNIFLLDRFCSLTTGWNTSLTSDDVRRKLPCDGWLWAREEVCDTPYFGIWNKSAAKMGKSIAYIPAHYPTPEHEVDQESVHSPGARQGVVDISKLGAFAYCIEATESLAQVTTYFLQQNVDFQNRQEVGSWLTRFKELDLRLVHWKMFLPQKWKDSNISQDISLVEMDPNLTLAHITHNTSMILLHQHIAYPPPDWTGLVKLPSSCSAETCVLAAVETVSITQKYLKHTTKGLVNSQFALCAFIAGRILLVHWRFYNKELLPEFFLIVECLQEMSRRWQGPSNPYSQTNLAGQYAIQLEATRHALSEDSKFHLQVLGYMVKDSHSTTDSLLPPFVLRGNFNQEVSQRSKTAGQPQTSPKSTNNIGSGVDNSNSSALQIDREQFLSSPAVFEPSAQSHTYATEMWRPTMPPASKNTQHENLNYRSGNHDNESVDDELTAMSHILLGQQFMDMDRVITFEDANFALDMSHWQDMQPMHNM